ncbi:dihydrolipoyl dehydrogenase family protein [Polycladidibacter hongkongensis]|uniref:dihydrolipoyl dehydrogenase family protein n=1 Tax=Polycladidibacter hongkongensis TaxID=1647556 RepID=UPI00082AC91A|nr:FAD-dependent oxidoreductase [Pseudovibrio hongkongensis]
MSEQTTLCPDTCIIGAGAAGLTAAAALSAFGRQVVLIEKGKMGGDCLNYGCVPSKALLAAAERANAVQSAGDLLPQLVSGPIDFAVARKNVEDAIAAIAPHDSKERFEELGVSVLRAEARFISPRLVQATALNGAQVLVKARRFIVATGATATVPPIPGLEQTPYLTNENLFSLQERPKHLLVIGAGPIGVEMAQAHARLGSKVTIIESAQPLSGFEPRHAEMVLAQLQAEGVDLLSAAHVKNSHYNADASCQERVKLTVETQAGVQTIAGSHLLLATGRKPKLDKLGLREAGVATRNGFITVSSNLKTSNRRIFALGDVNGLHQFTHAAGGQAALAVRNILFRLPVNHRKMVVPAALYTSPELACVGMLPSSITRGDGLQVLSAPFSQNDRAVAAGHAEGELQIVVGKKGRLCGASAVGVGAGELIGLLASEMSRGSKVGALLSNSFPYPTYGELIKRVALQYYANVPKKPLLRRAAALLARLG